MVGLFVVFAFGIIGTAWSLVLYSKWKPSGEDVGSLFCILLPLGIIGGVMCGITITKSVSASCALLMTLGSMVLTSVLVVFSHKTPQISSFQGPSEK